jgi:hypothetical protein
MQSATSTKSPATERKGTNTITVELPREESDRLKAIAREKGMLFSAFLKEHLRKAL